MSRTAAHPVSPSAPPGRSSPRPSAALVLTALLATGYALLFGRLSLLEYWAYEMHALDMGNMAQAAWNTVHGHPFIFTNMRLPYQIEAWGTSTRLSFHVEAIYPLISLVYLIYPYPESLLVLQTLAIASGAFAVLYLARTVLRSDFAALAFVAAYLLFPSLEAMNLYEFHPVSLATPLLLFAFLFAVRRRWVLFTLCCLAAMGTKEEIGLVVALLGLYVAFRLGQRRLGITVAGAGVFWALFAVLVIEHHYRQPGSLSYVHTRYGYLFGGPRGHGLHAVLHTIGHDPGIFLRVLFTGPKLGYLILLFAPVAFLCLLAPEILLLGLPTFVLNLMSTDPHMFSGLGDNSAELIAVVIIAGIIGAARATDVLRSHLLPRVPTRILAIGVIGAAVISQILNGYTPAGAYYHQPVITRHDRIANRFVDMIPPHVPVSTQDQLDPHLSSRRYLYLFEDTGRETPPVVPADSILLDVSAPTYPLPSFQIHDRAEGWLRKAGWGIAAARDGLILIRRGASAKHPPMSFYSYSLAGSRPPAHRLRGMEFGLRVLGYDMARTDLANHRVPDLAATVYLQPTQTMRTDIQPVLYEVMGSTMVGCSNEPLGLAWFPTSRWHAGTRYVVRMTPLETQWQTPGTARLYLALRPVPQYPHPSCAADWSRHGALWPAGTVELNY